MVMRWCVLWSLILLMQAAPVRANPDLEARIVEIEQRNVQAPWPESAALIEALGPEVAQASPEQRARVELVRLRRSEEHTSELQSLMRTSYAVFCLKKKTNKT